MALQVTRRLAADAQHVAQVSQAGYGGSRGYGADETAHRDAVGVDQLRTDLLTDLQQLLPQSLLRMALSLAVVKLEQTGFNLHPFEFTLQRSGATDGHDEIEGGGLQLRQDGQQRAFPTIECGILTKNQSSEGVAGTGRVTSPVVRSWNRNRMVNVARATSPVSEQAVTR